MSNSTISMSRLLHTLVSKLFECVFLVPATRGEPETRSIHWFGNRRTVELLQCQISPVLATAWWKAKSPAGASGSLAVLAAMRQVPREAFVRTGFEEFAYEDSPLPIGEDQTISQPYVVAAMAEAVELGPEAGCWRSDGFGLRGGRLEPDRASGLRDRAAIERRLRRLASASPIWGTITSTLRAGDGTQGGPEAAPF